MKKSALFLAAAAAVAASSMALAQTIDAPAGSTDTGVRAQVAITPVDTSTLATKTEVNNAYNNAINWTETRYGQSVNLTNTRYNQAVNYAYTVGTSPQYGTVMRTGVGQVNMNGSHITTRVMCMYGSFSQPYFGTIERNPCAAGETFVPVGTLYIDGYQGY